MILCAGGVVGRALQAPASSEPRFDFPSMARESWWFSCLGVLGGTGSLDVANSLSCLLRLGVVIPDGFLVSLRVTPWLASRLVVAL